MLTRDDQGSKGLSNKCRTCEGHNITHVGGEEKIMKGVVDSFRRLDGLPLIETEDGTAIILKEFKKKPEKGEEIEYEVIASHGNVTYAKRIGE